MPSKICVFKSHMIYVKTEPEFRIEILNHKTHQEKSETERLLRVALMGESGTTAGPRTVIVPGVMVSTLQQNFENQNCVCKTTIELE